MSISPISQIATSLIQPVTSLLSSATTTSTGSSSSAIQTDADPQISGAAKFLNVLQLLATSNPTEFKQITSQISNQLTQAATDAKSQGDTTDASQLTNLASQFNTASQTGQLPSSLLNQSSQTSATGTTSAHHGHHHHHGGSAYGTSQSDSSDVLSLLGSSTGTSTASASTVLNN